MATFERLVATVESIHAAGLNPELWPRVLHSMAKLFGVTATTLEHIDNRTLCHRHFYSFGIPSAQELRYLNDYAPLNLRLPFHAKAKADEVLWDYKVLDEATMNRAPFYVEFLAPIGFRYFLSGVLTADEGAHALVSLQRTKKEGHCDQTDIALMRRLVPHIRQAFDVTRRLKGAGELADALERTFDWFADGVALVRADGKLTYANDTFQTLIRHNNGFRLHKGALEFADPVAQEKFNAAVAAAWRLRAGEVANMPTADFVASRPGGGSPYAISIRLLLHKSEPRPQSQAIVMIFVRDVQRTAGAAGGTLRDLFGLTEAEAALAQALQSGVTSADYARSHALSLNTVYTHLRRVREKTGCSSMAELIYKLNALQPPVRPV